MFNQIVERIRPARPPLLDRIHIEYGEILSQEAADAIMFFMLPSLEWGEGLNGAILEAAGPELDACLVETVTKIRSGEVYALPPFKSKFKQLFVAILAPWDGGIGFEDRDLMNCYRRTIRKAQDMGITTIAIPALGRDKRDFPHIRFARLALRGIVETMDRRTEKVTIHCFDQRMMRTYQEQLDRMKRR